MDSIIFRLSLAVLILTASEAVIRQRPKNSKTCPAVSNMDEFSMERFNGTWYEVYTSMANSTLVERCDRIKLSAAARGRLSIYRRFINAQGIEVKSMGIAAEIEEGVVAFHYPAFMITNLYEIIITDYDSYAILYYCTNDFEFWVYSRQPEPNAQLLVLIFQKLRERGFTKVKIYRTDQLNCAMKGF
ncbi:hypothetical protein ACKWTF_001300 [Chironomus riparius]